MKFTDKDSNRFWEKVDIAGDNDCWEWMACKMGNGYGKIRWPKRLIGAHRVSWMIANNKDIPNGMCVLHRCDNPGCMNPNHLFLGTHADNMQDAFDKGRNTNVGENGPNSKLTHKQVVIIKKAIAETKIKYGHKTSFCKCWANKFNVRWENIRAIVNNKSWTHISV